MIAAAPAPLIVAVAGPNGAGKSRFYEAYLKASQLPFVNADVIARGGSVTDPYQAAKLADKIRQAYVARRESFIFETVLSDPKGDKVQSLKNAADAGYHVTLCFIGLESPRLSEERVAIRVMQGGHDVPTEKILARYPRSLENLVRAVACLPEVLIYDNSQAGRRHRFVACYQRGIQPVKADSLPLWFSQLDLP